MDAKHQRFLQTTRWGEFPLMLPSVTLPASLASLVRPLRSCFTVPSFAMFCALLVGQIAAIRRRTVCGMWIAAGLSRLVRHGRAHWFFARARWCPDTVGLAVAAMIVDLFLPADAAVEVVVDDTLFRVVCRQDAPAGEDPGRVGGVLLG
ncbi:transposase [Micromonospora sp. NPDC050795]|uniref:transposase n=1 Tax=Micromonospora sp. NPDC050795 TaxID=3364282 RepID=UPI0037AF8F9E